MRSALAVPVERPVLRRFIEWLAPWYDSRAERAKAAQVERAVRHANTSAKAADAAIADSRRDEVRASFARANERLGR